MCSSVVYKMVSSHNFIVPSSSKHETLSWKGSHMFNIYTLLHELACNITSYCTSGRGIFTSRRRVKMQPTSAIIAMCMLTSVIKCLLSIPE